MLFQQSPDLVWGVIAALFVGNLVLLLLNIPMVGVFVKLLSIPPKYLMPIVTLIASVGIFSITGSAIDLYFMVGFGIMGYVLRKVEIPLVPVILGMLLGPEMEKNLRHALVLSDGDWTVLWSSGLSIGLWVVALAGLILPMVFGKVLRSKMKRSKDSSAA
jgi:putative tricarboxylic transport membrane protein